MSEEVEVKVEKKIKKWSIFAIILLILQLASSVVSIVELCILNMLPDKLVVASSVGLAFLLVFVGLLLLLKGKAGKLIYVRRGVGVFISLAMIVACVAVTYYVGRLNHTVSAISADSKVSNLIGIYVQADDPAKELKDARGYTYGITEEYDYEHTETTIEEIEKQLGSKIGTTKYESVEDMVDALYRGDVGAIILNKAYVDLLTDEKQYEDFERQMRVLYEYEIVEDDPMEDLLTQSTDGGTKSVLTEEPFILYISGSDTRELSLQTSRSDVNLLAIVNPKSKQVLLLNTPRDYYIDTAKAPGNLDKLTHCGLYGTSCSMQTLSNLYGEEIKYYMQINFEGFRQFTTAIGGVVVDNEEAFVSYKDNYSYPKGEVELSGDYALSYVRERKAFPDGDYRRGKHQMKVIKAIIEKMRNSNTLLTNYTELMKSLEGMFVTNLTATDMSELVKMQLSDNASWTVNTFTVIGTGASRYTYSMPNRACYVTIPDMNYVERGKELVDKIFAGGTLTENDLIVPDSEEEEGGEAGTSAY